jgi:hypothetical protein
MREIDKLEAAAFGHTPKSALRHGMAHSVLPQTALVDGVPVAMFGVVAVNLIEGHGRPWLLGTDALVQHGLPLCVGARRYLKAQSAVFRLLDNWIAEDNLVARLWLSRLGFSFDQTTVINGLRMQRFERSAGNV